MTIKLLLLAAVMAAISFAAYAHGDAWWIQQGGYRNSVGELCCGEHDCQPLVDDDVVAVDGGYYVKSLKETIPYSQAQPSPDGHFWRCSWPRIEDRKCFFAPPQSY